MHICRIALYYSELFRIIPEVFVPTPVMRGMNEYKIFKFSSCQFSLRTFSESYLLRHFIINYGHVLDMTGYHTPYSKMAAIFV